MNDPAGFRDLAVAPTHRLPVAGVRGGVAWLGRVFDSMDATIYLLGMVVLLKARETKHDVLR